MPLKVIGPARTMKSRAGIESTISPSKKKLLSPVMNGKRKGLAGD